MIKKQNLDKLFNQTEEQMSREAEGGDADKESKKESRKNVVKKIDEEQKQQKNSRVRKKQELALYANCEQYFDKDFDECNKDIDSVEILKHVLHVCDVQIAHFMQLIQNAKQAPNGLIVTGTSQKKEEIQGTQRGVESDFCENQTVTNTMASYELILRYNNEIEKAKREKLRCLELLAKLYPANQEDLPDDGFMDALSDVAQSTWESKADKNLQLDLLKDINEGSEKEDGAL